MFDKARPQASGETQPQISAAVARPLSTILKGGAAILVLKSVMNQIMPVAFHGSHQGCPSKQLIATLKLPDGDWGHCAVCGKGLWISA